MNQAVFLDKDGTLVEDLPYNADAARLALVPGAGSALRLLADRGYRLVVISNQSGVAHGYFSEAALGAVRRRLYELFLEEGLRLTGFYYCPHHPEGRVKRYAFECGCRKPAPGLLLRAAREHGIDLSWSWFVGDILDDVEAGRRAGCRTVLLDNGHETEWELAPLRLPHVLAGDLQEAALAISRAEAARGARRGAMAR